MDIQPTYEEQPPAQGTNKVVWWVVGAGCALALCFCLILSGLGIYSVYNSSALTGFGPATATVIPPVASVDYHTHFRPNGASLGDPNAPVKIEIYSDFQCPYCRFFWRDTEELIFKNYVATSKVYFTYRSMAAFIGEESQKAAEAAYCAGDQEKFWEYHDIVFANQGPENSGAFSDENLTGFAQTLNLDMKTFSTCFSGGKYTERVKKDREDATAAGVKATPTFLINGTIIEGSQPYENFKNVIDDALIGGG